MNNQSCKIIFLECLRAVGVAASNCYVCKEGMRLHPVGAFICKSGRDIATKNKDEILSKGSICLLTYISKCVYDSDSFDPSRLESPSKEMTDETQPFGLRKRNCVGQLLEKSETQAIVEQTISEFELTLVEEGTVDFFLTLKPVGARLRARRVTGSEVVNEDKCISLIEKEMGLF